MPNGREGRPSDLPDLERFRGYLLGLVRSRLGCANTTELEASDIVQQALLSAYRGLHGFRGGSDAELAAWLGRIVSLTVVDRLRALQRERRRLGQPRSIEAIPRGADHDPVLEIADDLTSPSEVLAREERAQRLARALAALPEAQARALHLRHIDGLGLVAIAAAMGKSPAAVAGLLKRGLSQLRESFPDLL